MAKHAKKMEKQGRALYLHVNNRQSVSKPEDGESLNDMGGRLESPSGEEPDRHRKNVPGAPRCS
jgi:hypothetical protein